MIIKTLEAKVAQIMKAHRSAIYENRFYAIVVNHAPQMELLKKSSVCITHAGFNTILEALTQGVPRDSKNVSFDPVIIFELFMLRLKLWLFAPNRPDALAVRYATNLLGAATYYLSAPSDPRHRADLLALTDPELLVLFSETAHLLPAGLGVPIAAIGTNLDGASLRLDEAAASQSSTPMARPGVHVRFRRDDGTLAGTGEIGTIEVRSPAVASGYHNRPDLKASFRDGWFHSNDLGYFDASDYLHVLGRADDIAWIDGTMLSPAGIQETLCRLSSVRNAAVVRDVEAGSWISTVVPWPGSSVDLAQCRQVIAATYGAASIIVVPVDRVPLTPQGKADRIAVAKSAASLPVSPSSEL